MDIYAQYATDEAAETRGAWKDIGPGARLLVARLGNEQYASEIQSEVDTHRLQLDLGGKVGQRVNDEIMVRVVAKTLLKGWEGLSYKGAEVAYTYDNACLLLGHKDFRALVVEIANDIKTFLVKEEIAQGKT